MDRPADENKAPDVDVETTEADDVEGHSFGSAVLGSLIAGSSARQRTPDQRVKDESLPPLTKPFPRMRDDKTK